MLTTAKKSAKETSTIIGKKRENVMRAYDVAMLAKYNNRTTKRWIKKTTDAKRE